MDNQTPETVRTAAYLATRERLDARKTNRNVQCNPPNVRCGNRCIPPSWDCRLKGEGPDPHLRAVKTDPLGGLANIERGGRRILRGVAKGSFSEVEGGKRAIIRGAVKIAPGNLQQKKELQKQLENRTRAIGIGLAVLTGGLGAHALLMKQSPMYRQGLGRSINEAVQTGVNSVLDATPGLAGRRSRTRTAAFSGISEAATRETRIPAMGPDALASGLAVNSPAALNQLRNTALGSSNVTGNSNLNNALRRVNQQARKDRTTNIYEWDQKHREAFWNTKIKADELDREINVFARPAAEDFIRRQYNITAADSATDIKEALRQKLSEERSSYVLYAKQLGFRTETQAGIELVHKDDRFRFVQTLNRASGLTGSLRRNAKDLADAHVTKLISPTSLSNYSRSIYNKNLEDFDNFYTQVGKAVRSTPGAASLREELVLAGGNKGIPSLSNEQRQFLSALSRTRVNDMARRMRAARLPGGQSTGFARPITGEAHAELVKTAYFHIEVIGQQSRRAPDALRQGNARFRGPRTYTISDNLAINAASELSGRPISTANDAFRLLNTEYGFPGATRVRQPGAAAVPRTGLRRQAALSTLAREIMSRAGNEGMSLEAAYRAAKREIEQRGDASPELVRTATYLAARADLQEGTGLGKPCGASHIPKSHECRKGQSAAPSSAPQTSASRGRTLAAAAAVTAGAGLTVAGLMAYRNRTTLVPGLSQEAIRKLSADQVKAGLDKLPEQFRGPARKLVGDAKLAAAHMALRAQGAQIKAVDVDHNFSTWVTASGTHLSVGSVGDSLLTFGAERKGNIGKFPQYGLGFTVNSSYDAAGGMPSSQAKQLIRTTKAMYKAQLDMLPDDAFLFAVPHKADGKGGKRKSIYEGFGFKAIPGLKGDKLWALKNQGQFTEIPEAQFDYLRNMIRGDRSDAEEGLRLGKPCGASYIPKAHNCQSNKTDVPRRRLALAVTATGAVALTAALTAKHWTPAAQQILDNARPVSKSNPPKGASYFTEGTSGQTWISKDNKYLIKTPKGKFNRAKFTNEVNIQNALADAGISVPKIHNVDARKGIVMMDYLKDHQTLKTLPREKTGAALRTLLKEVEKMHMLGYSHGDLHAGNVLVKGPDVKIIDFGYSGPVAKNGLSDINHLFHKSAEVDNKLHQTIAKHRSVLQVKLSSGKTLTQRDFLAFHEAVRKELRSTG